MLRTRLALLPAFLLLPGLLVACGDKDDGGGDGEGPVDADGDGFDTTTDCDDGDASIHPDATEVCDGVDNDCDDAVDDEDSDVDLTGAATWYADVDFDGYGDPDAPVQGCAQPASTVSDATDCDDGDDSVHPGADELCNGADDDCDEEIDEDATGLESWWMDGDGDGFGDPAAEVEACEQPDGAVANDADCDDDDATVFPGAVERCNEADDDCSTATTEAGVASFEDLDGTWTDWTDTMSGGSARAAEVSIDEPGTLHLCEGTWYATVDVFADVDVIGHGDVTVDAAGDGAVFEVGDDDVALRIEGIDVAGGVGESSTGFGTGAGGISCETEGSSVQLSGVRVRGNSGSAGGGLLAYQCSVSAEATTFESNEAEIGGGLSIWFSDATLESVTIAGNEAASAGGMYADGGNLSVGGGEIVRNSSESGAGGVALWVYDSDVARFDAVDFGEEDTSADNDPHDVQGNGAPYLVGDDATFSCTSAGCGTPETFSIGSDDYSVSLLNRAYGSIIQADRTVTLSGLSFYAYGPDTCSVDAYVLRRSTDSDWTVLWSSTYLTASSRPAWLDAGDPDLLLREGSTYAFLLGARCSGSTGVTFYYASDGGESDADFGITEAYGYPSTYSSTLSGTTSLYTSETTDLAFSTRFEITEL